MKYICTEDEKGKEEIFLFPSHIDHDAMAEGLEGFRNQTYGNWERLYRKPISAGFIMLENGQLVCGGNSQSLDLKSRHKPDTELLNKQMQ